VPADIRIIRIYSTTLRVDQAILTGSLFFFQQIRQFLFLYLVRVQPLTNTKLQCLCFCASITVRTVLKAYVLLYNVMFSGFASVIAYRKFVNTISYIFISLFLNSGIK